MGTHLSSSLNLAIPLALLASAASWPTTFATDLLHNGGWPSGSDCVDQAWNSDQVYVYTCHGQPNQQWELNSDGQIRSAEGNCLEYFDDQNKVVAVKCDTSRRQKWYLANGLIKPQGFRLPTGAWVMRVGMCLDSAQPDGKLTLYGCHGATNQKFSASFLPTNIVDDVVQVDGTWATNNGNCLDYDFSAGFAYVYACHGQWNQRWHFTADDEIRVSGSDSMCLEYDAKDQALVRACSKAENQKWVVLDDGHVQPKASPTKCLDASYATSKLSLAACVADKPNQKFRSTVLKPKFRDLLQVKGPWADGQTCVDYAWGTDYAYIYSCHGQANQLWEFTNDEQIRTTENKCLEFDGDALSRVAVKPCDSQRATQKWRPKASGAIMPRGYFDSTSTWRVPNKCIDAALEDKKLQLWDCVDDAVNQKFRSTAMPTRTRDLVFADGASLTPGFNCVRGLDGLVLVAKCGATREMLWEFRADGSLVLDVDGGSVCLTASGGGSSGKVELAKCTGAGSQKWERTATGGIALQASASGWGQCLDWKTAPSLSLVKCVTGSGTGGATQRFSSTMFTTVASGALNGLYEKTALLSTKIKSDAFLTTSVLSSASDVVKEAERVLASSDKTDTQRATDFLLQFLTKSDNVTSLSVKPRALYLTSESEEFLVILSMLLLQTTQGGSSTVLQAITPAIRTFSDQLFDARYEVLLDHVVRGDVNRLEAYADGTLSDFDAVAGMLTAVCTRLSTSAAASTAAASMCRLSSYFALIDQFFQLKYRLMVEGPRAISAASLAMARTVAQTFKSNQALLTADPLWKRLMTLLVFGAPYVDVLPSASLARASRGDAYLPTFVLYAALGSDKFVDELTPMVRFLSDQITTFHVNNVLGLTTAKDIAGLEAYMAEPINTYSVLNDTSSTSDFATVAQFVVPRVCGDPAREQLSLCQLDQVHVGLQTVLRFERSRRSNVVSLDDVLEVDVRKKLDVIDQEKKQFEMLSTLQEVANKIGSTILKGMADLKTQIATSTAVIRSDIEATRQDLRQAIGAVGQQLQTSIEQSTDLLYNQVGQQAASIRRDIFDSSQRLEQRLDDTGRAILGSIEQSKQELKYQIGAEAEATRAHITAKSDELKDHMTKETQGLREFIDVKTNQVIGVVREEGASTREEVNKATNQIVREVRSEGAITRAFVDTKTNEIKEVVRSESAITREFVDASTNKVIGVVQEEGRTTRSFVNEKGDQVIGVVKDEGDKTRKEVRAEGDRIRTHIDEKTTEIVGVVRDEGSKTRADVNARAAELKQHVTDQSTLVKDQVKKTQGELQSKMDKQYTDLSSGISQVGASVEASTSTIVDGQKLTVNGLVDDKLIGCSDMWDAGSTFKQVYRAYTQVRGELGRWIDDVTTSHNQVKGIIDSNDRLRNMASMQIFVPMFRFASAATAYLKLDLDGAIRLASAQQDNAKFREDTINTQASSIASICQFHQSQLARIPKEWDGYKRMIQGEKIEFSTPDFNAFTVMLDWTAIRDRSVLITATDTKQNYNFNNIRNETQANFKLFYGSANEPAYLWNLYDGGDDIFSRYSKALEALRLSYRENVISALRCESAQKAKDWASSSTSTRLLRRALQGSISAGQPYYAMTFTALTKLLLDYRIQEAAEQFCNYYEFRNGGVAPPMCGRSLQAGQQPYYSLSKIQEMRAWQPPVYPRITTRVLLPTQPSANAETGRPYPYVDLARLARGEAVMFNIPTWDLEWLKRNLWVLPNAKEDSLSSYYVESMSLYLPFDLNATSKAASTPFAVTAYAESSMTQIASWQNQARTYQLTPQTLKFDVVYNQPVCTTANKATNPYHEAAECVATVDRSSQLCLRPSASENAQRLLPSLFSSWRIRADFDVNSTRYRLVQPPQELGSVELSLFADLTLVEVATASPRTVNSINSVAGTQATTTAVASSCCAQDEYRPLDTGACTKCPPGSVSALNGYTCTAI